MKLRQKIYDSSESINRLIKITNSFHHYNNLKKIRERKPIYNINNFNNKRNKKSLNSDLGVNKNYIYNSKDNDIIINSIEKMKYNGFFNDNNNLGIIKEKRLKERKKNYSTSENNKNNGYSKHKNNKNKLFLPPIRKYKK